MPIPELAGAAVLVTGGAGFIGSHLVDALLDRGARVRVLDSLVNGKLANLGRWLPAGGEGDGFCDDVSLFGRLEFRRGDIRDLDACRRCCEGVKLVFHQAALGSVPRSLADPATTIAVNVTGTANLFAAARDAGVERIIFASSSSVYGDSELLPKREGEEGRPLSPYALSKVQNEQLAEVFSRAFGVELIGLRYFNIYGPRQDSAGPYAAVIPRFFAACLRGEPPVIYGDGEQSRDFTFVSDAVRANLLAAGTASAACGRSYNVASGRRVSVNQLAGIVGEVSGRRLSPRHEPARPGDIRHSLACVERAQEALGFAPEVALPAGLGLTFADYETQEPRP